MQTTALPTLPALSRRRWLSLGVGAAVVLATGSVWLWQPGVRDGRLSRSGRTVFRAVARSVLEGSLPTEPSAQAVALDAQLDRLDLLIAGLPPFTRDDIARLIALLDTTVGRRWLAGLTQDWAQASVIELAAALERMRVSDHALRQQAYHALRDLTNAAFYAEPAQWPLLGYPGPLAV